MGGVSVIRGIPDVWRVVACKGHSRGQEASYFPLSKLKHLMLCWTSFPKISAKTQGLTLNNVQDAYSKNRSCVVFAGCMSPCCSLADWPHSIVPFPITNTLTDKDMMSCPDIILHWQEWCLPFLYQQLSLLSSVFCLVAMATYYIP